MVSFALYVAPFAVLAVYAAIYDKVRGWPMITKLGDTYIARCGNWRAIWFTTTERK